MCAALDLRLHADSCDLFDPAGRPAALFRESDDALPGVGRAHFLYLRQNLLSDYLQNTRQKFAWIPWGERTLAYPHFSDGGITDSAREIMQRHAHNFGELIALE
jgi:hypothetical protein